MLETAAADAVGESSVRGCDGCGAGCDCHGVAAAAAAGCVNDGG